MRPATVLVALLVAALAAGCGSSSKKSKTTTTTATTARPSAAQASVPTGCQTVAKPKAKPDGKLDKPSLSGPPPKTATIVTNCGAIQIAFDTKDQPKTAASFAYLAKRGFFDGTTFWRVQRQPDGSDFVIQGGDPTNSGTGGPGYSVTEKPPKNAQYTRGVVAMAKTEIEKPGTSGSQFFIVTAEDAGLPADYAVLGHVTGGMKAVQRIAAAQSDPQTGRATQYAVIQSVKTTR